MMDKDGPIPSDPQKNARLRGDLSTFALDSDLVLFSDEAQCLVGLNAPAAFIFRKLQEGIGIPEIEKSLVMQGLASSADAGNWIANTLDSLRAHGMLAGAPLPQTMRPQAGQDLPVTSIPPYIPVVPAAERYYRLLGATALMRFAHKAQLRLVDAVIGHMAIAKPEKPSVVFDIAAAELEPEHLASYIYRDGEPMGHAQRLSQLGPVVKALLWQSAVNSYDFLFYIHAGVVATDSACVILPAAAGSGKSTFTAALAHAGFRFYSDEVALLDRLTLRVPPMPLAICTKERGWPIMERYYPQLADLPRHLREDGKIVRYIPPPPGVESQSPRTVTHIIFPRYVPGSDTELKIIPRSVALARLMAECLALRQRLDNANVTALIRWISGIDCYEMKLCDLDQAVDVVKELTGVS